MTPNDSSNLDPNIDPKQLLIKSIHINYNQYTNQASQLNSNLEFMIKNSYMKKLINSVSLRRRNAINNDKNTSYLI